jgi:hypothetical protein
MVVFGQGTPLEVRCKSRVWTVNLDRALVYTFLSAVDGSRLWAAMYIIAEAVGVVLL